MKIVKHVKKSFLRVLRVLHSCAPLILIACALAVCAPHASATTDVPAKLSDADFWALSQDSSEPGGYFRQADITNLTSNEMLFQHVVPELVSRVKPGRVYLGVGPEQNYTYIAALKPSMVIIFDIRRGNLDLQLMYKALFEMAKDRADFISLLFSKPRPDGLSIASTAAELFGSIGRVETSKAMYEKTLAAITSHLTKSPHTLPIPQRDIESIEQVFQLFYTSGFYLRASPSYADLMMATDATGKARSYLATEEAFSVMKDLEARNMVVPVVGDFSGPKAIRAVGKYLHAQQATVGAFYISNVEQYLVPDSVWNAFCRNVATLPLDASSTFIRSQSGGGGGFGRGVGFINSLGTMTEETRNCR